MFGPNAKREGRGALCVAALPDHLDLTSTKIGEIARRGANDLLIGDIERQSVGFGGVVEEMFGRMPSVTAPVAAVALVRTVPSLSVI